ncbi:MAG: hypothetical protein ACRDG3_11980 [Tepidiformaceae bacterium]
MSYSVWLARYLADPAAVSGPAARDAAPAKHSDCTRVRLEFRVHGATPADRTCALERLAPPGAVAFGPVMVDDTTAAVAYHVDWDWAES